MGAIIGDGGVALHADMASVITTAIIARRRNIPLLLPVLHIGQKRVTQLH